MKKIIVLLSVLFLTGLANAQNAYTEHEIDVGIRQGDTLFSLFVGGATPMAANAFNVDINDTHEEMKWGKMGVQYGVSVFYFVHDFVGVGLEASGVNSTYAQKWIGNTQYKTATDLWNGMILGRININPYQPVRVYVPAGVGLTWARNRWETNDGQESPIEKSLSYGYFVGLGIETNFRGKDKSIGLEVRYSGFGADLDNRLAGAIIREKNKLEYLSILLKLNYRF
ncbi:MAG: porin family protein [Elusimicrobiaceae bacterium]|nr:porin family protein [Elusimicrobiaceae bacterium]